MKYILFIILSITLLFTSCVDELDHLPIRPGKETILYLSLPERKEVETQDDSEHIDNQSVYVLILSDDSDSAQLLDFAVGVETGSSDIKSYRISLQEQREACHAYVVVNARDVLDTAAQSWERGVTTLDEIARSLMTTPLPTTSKIIVEMPNLHPMVGKCALPSLTSGMSIGSSANPVQLTPVTVKVSVVNRASSGLPYSFVLTGASLGNMPEKSFILPNQSGQITLRNYGSLGDISNMVCGVGTVEGIPTTQPLYGYESKAANNSFVLIKATYNGMEGYYKLGFYTDAEQKATRPLLRGHHYKVVIRQVLTAGYRTAEEALSSPPSNDIHYDINVDDPDSFDIITNGKQYLGVSNSEYILYNSNFVNEWENFFVNQPVNDSSFPWRGELTPFTAAVVTYTTDPSWRTGTAIASEGIDFVLEDNRTKTTQMELPLQQDDQPVRKELRILMTDEFTRGTITLHIGNLLKVIRIERHPSITVLGGIIPLGKDIVYAKVRTLIPPNEIGNFPYKNPEDYNIGYAANGGTVLQGEGSVETDPAQELCIRVRNRFNDLANNQYCYGELYAHRNTSAGRVKVSFAAEMRGMNPNGDIAHTLPINLSGAFWKSDEKGERLIQLLQTDELADAYLKYPYVGRWQVRVIAGEDFIRLGKWDDNLVASDGKRFDGDPETRPADYDELTLSGTDVFVRFRIRLTDTNVGKPNRYGAVQILFIDHRGSGDPYNNHKIGLTIFVRQGEKPEYLLTPGKRYSFNVSSSYAMSYTAPAVKFAPYMPIDPGMNPGGPSVTDHTQITTDTRPVLAPYPSYQGYLFQWSPDRMFSPSIPDRDIPINGWNAQYAPTEFTEPSPAGFMIPPAKIDGQPVSHGLGLYSYDGIYLDGHTDRHLQLSIHPTYKTVTFTNYARHTINYNQLVSKSGNGILYYNPETLASIYFPISVIVAPMRFPGDGILNPTRRYDAMIWTRDTASSMNAIALPIPTGVGVVSLSPGAAYPKALALPLIVVEAPPSRK